MNNKEMRVGSYYPHDEVYSKPQLDDVKPLIDLDKLPRKFKCKYKADGDTVIITLEESGGCTLLNKGETYKFYGQIILPVKLSHLLGMKVVYNVHGKCTNVKQHKVNNRPNKYYKQHTV